MRKFIYNSVIDRLREIKDAGGNPVIRHFDIWNNNLNYIADNEAFYTPAVFVEFARIDWRHQGRGMRDAEVRVLLHVVSQRNAPTSAELPYAEHSLEFFRLLTDINVCLHGYFCVGDNFSHDALTSISSETDHDFEELRHDIEVFACHASEFLKIN